MIVTALELIDFGCFAAEKISFAGGLNLVIGPNESGKSTIQAALKTGFFGERQGYQRWKRRTSDSPTCSIVIEYVLEDKSAWRLERDLAKNEVGLRQIREGKAVFVGPTEVAKAVCRHLGLDSADAFMNTVFVRVGELATDLKEIEPSLRARVESILVGSVGGSISGAVKVLKTRYRRLAGTVSLKGRGGRIGELTAKKAELDSQIDRAEKAEAMRLELAAELEQTEALLVERSERLKLVSQLVGAISTKQSLEKKNEELSNQRRKLRLKVERIIEDRKKTDAIKEEMTVLAEYKDINSTEAAALKAKLKDFRAKKMELDAATDGGNPSSAPSSKNNGLLLVILGVISLGTGLGLAVFGRIVAGFALMIAGIVVLVAGWLINRPSTPSADSRDIYIKEELKRLDVEIKEALDKTSAADVATFMAKYNKYDSLARELANIEHAESIILESGSLEVMNKELDRLIDESEVIDRQLAGMTIADMTPEEVFARERELAYLEPEVADLRQVRDTLIGRIQSHGQLSGLPLADLAAEIDYVDQQLSRTRQYADAVELATSEIEAIAAEISGEVAPDISAKASYQIDRLTSGAYERVEMAADLAPVLLKAGSSIKPETLSTGTADQLYFAIRLAAADLISGDLKPPLILDDPFVYFDSARLTSAGEIIADLASERQIILFSHDRTYESWPGKKIRLSSPSVRSRT